MSPITLAQAKVGLADKVVQNVIDEFRRASFILDALTFDNSVSSGTGGSTLTYGYLQLLTPSLAAGRAINAEYTPGEALKTKKTTEVKIFGGAFQVDRVLEGSAATSEIALQLQQKIIAARNKFHYDFINGDSAVTATDFDGLDKLVTGSSTEYEPTAIDLSSAAAIASNAATFVYELDTFLAMLDGKPDALLVNSKTATAIATAGRILGYYSQREDAFGNKVNAYNDIAIVDMGEYYNGSATVPCIEIDDTTKLTSIYAVKFGMDALHGVSVTGDKLVRSYLPDLNAPGAVKLGEVEMLAGLALKNSKKAGVMRNIKVAPTA